MGVRHGRTAARRARARNRTLEPGPGCVLALALVCAGCASGPPLEVMGAYRFSDGSVMSVRPSVDETLRVRVFESGDSRRLYPEGELRYVSGAGFSVKEPVEVVVTFDTLDGARGLSWRGAAGESRRADRVGRAVPVTFESEGVRLVGRLDLPESEGPHSAVVLVQGSGRDAATETGFHGDFLVANGVAALTYDKRGTGGSGGHFTFDFHQLARDVVAAVDVLRSHPEIDSTRIGVVGYSQGGWIAPLAACLSPEIGFVVVNYGMIESPAEEARLEAREALRKRGVDEASLDRADSLTLAGVAIVASGFRSGWDEFEALRDRFRNELWLKEVTGPVADLMRYPKWLVKLFGPGRTPPGLRWYYDSGEVLRHLDTPMVWLLGNADESAPNERTIERLKGFRSEGKPFDLIVFQGADHGMLIFEENEGERVYTGYAPDYFRQEVARIVTLADSATTRRTGRGPVARGPCPVPNGMTAPGEQPATLRQRGR